MTRQCEECGGEPARAVVDAGLFGLKAVGAICHRLYYSRRPLVELIPEEGGR